MSHEDTNDGAHFYDELPCNIKKNDDTGNMIDQTMEDPSKVCT